jgi:hypothetical protein
MTEIVNGKRVRVTREWEGTIDNCRPGFDQASVHFSVVTDDGNRYSFTQPHNKAEDFVTTITGLATNFKPGDVLVRRDSLDDHAETFTLGKRGYMFRTNYFPYGESNPDYPGANGLPLEFFTDDKFRKVNG